MKNVHVFVPVFLYAVTMLIFQILKKNYFKREMVYPRRYFFLFFFWKMPKIWVDRTTVNGEKKEDGQSVQRWRFPEQQLLATF